MNRIGPDPSPRDCLVAVVNNDLDLERFTRDRWYRIPERALGRSLRRESLREISALALYQTAGISAGLPGAIELWGEVEDISTLTRRELLPEEPEHPAADEPYRLIRIGRVERLPAPVVAPRPRRITFLRTSRRRLLSATRIDDLFLGSPREEELWETLRGLDAERRVLMTVRDTVVEVDFAIYRDGCALGILCGDASISEPRDGDARGGDGRGGDGRGGASPEEPAVDAWMVLRFSPAELDADLARCLGRIMNLLDRMPRTGAAP